MTKLSVVLATHNEEENIIKCLKSIIGWAGEIVIVDGDSNDTTVNKVKKFMQLKDSQVKLKLIETTNKPIFHINKQMALDHATNPWILQLDADEQVSKILKDEILSTVNDQQSTKSGYFIPRKNFFLGKWLKKGGQYPDYVIRLVRKGKAKFPCKSVHEQIQIDGKVGYLKNPLLHHASPNFSRYWQNANRYTTLTAKEWKNKNVKLNCINSIKFIFWMPLKTFINIFFRHKGLVDGMQGFLFAFFSGLHYIIAFFKFWELDKRT